MTRNYKAYTWRRAEVTRLQHDLLIFLAAGYSNDQISTRLTLRAAELERQIELLKTTYNAHNVRMLISLALFDNEINLVQILPHIIASMNANTSKKLDD